MREFLRMVAAELARLQERERFLERELRTSQRSTSPSSIALDEELVTKMLGEEAARILQTSREAGTQIKIRAEEGASRLLREATDEAQRLREEAEVEAARRRQDATADAESELEMAKQQGREMVNEARAYRERVLNELARRRELARQQIEQLVHGRDRLLQAFERSRLVAVDVMAELTPLGEPNEYVDLSPTTGPVPLMVKNMPRPGSAADLARQQAEADLAAAAAAQAADHDDDATTVLTLVETTEVIEVIEFEVIEPVAIFDHANDDDDDDDDEVDDDDCDGQPDTRADAVVKLDISRSDDADQADDPDREPAQVVALFDIDRSNDDQSVSDDTTEAPADDADTVPDDESDDPMVIRASADDLFARLRAARAQGVAERAREAKAAPAAGSPLAVALEAVAALFETAPVAAGPTEDSVFLATADAPAVPVVVDDTAFARRDEALTPLIVAGARKLKRVLADEQNDVLHALRGKNPVRTIEGMVATEAEQVARYATAVSAELSAAAVAGAVSMGMRASAAQREVKKANATASAGQMLASELIVPLRARLQRCIADTEGDPSEMATLVRMVYREWKAQRIDEHLDDVARTAFGRGALAGVAAGTPICWMVDPAGPQCPDAEDNALAGVLPAGDKFPTDHQCAPAHSGCRCMIVTADP